MSEQLITASDVQYLASESDHNLNLILAEMTNLLDENDKMVSQLENQTWFQRMSQTISGKNKMTQDEVARNHDKINLYVSQAMGELFDRSCIDHQLILGLGNKINELYAGEVELKQIIGAFAQKLNQKIESIDNFHMLTTEIGQGVYDNANPFLSISRIMSQLDLRTVQDQRKMDILTRALEERKILTHEEMRFSEMLENLLTLQENDAGTLALFFNNISGEYIAQLAETTIYTYYTLPEKTRKMKSRHALVESVLRQENVDTDYAVSSYEICQTLIGAYRNGIVQAAMEEQKNTDTIRQYMSDVMSLLQLLNEMVPTWRVRNGELNTPASRKEYSEFMQNVISQLDEGSYIGSSVLNSLNSLTSFAQSMFSKFVDYRGCAKEIEDYKLNKTAALSAELLIDEDENGHLTIAQYYKKFLSEYLENKDDRRRYTLQAMEKVCAEWPDLSRYRGLDDANACPYAFRQLYANLFAKVTALLEMQNGVDEIYDLIQRFPVVYDPAFRKELIREFDWTKPYIEIEYPTLGGRSKQCDINYAQIPLLQNNGTTALILRFKNMKRENYAVRWNVLKNENVMTDKTKPFVTVEWGNWVEKDVLELKITKNHNRNIGELVIQISVKDEPDLAAYICYTY